MGGGVNPIEWVLPPLAATHMIVDQGATLTGNKLPPVPGSPAANEDDKAAEAQAKQQAALDAQAQAVQQAKDDLAARTETPQEANEAKRRAKVSASQFLGGKRRASQTLTDPGATLSGSY